MNVKNFISEKNINRVKKIAKKTVPTTVILLVLFYFGILQYWIGALSCLISRIPDNKFALYCFENAAEHGYDPALDAAKDIGGYFSVEGMEYEVEYNKYEIEYKEYEIEYLKYKIEYLKYENECLVDSPSTSIRDSLVLKREEAFSKAVQSYKEANRWYQLAGDPERLGESESRLGFAYYDKEDYAEAFKYYSMAAEQGDKEGMTRIGILYYNGWGIEKSYEEAEKWLLMAIEGGHNDAYIHLVHVYAGEGLIHINKYFETHNQITVDTLDSNWIKANQMCKKSVDLCLKAAKQDFSYTEHLEFREYLGESYNRLGDLYSNVDIKEGIEWYRMAAEHGHADGQYEIGRHLYYEKDGESSKSEAVKRLQMAAEQEHEGAIELLNSINSIEQLDEK